MGERLHEAGKLDEPRDIFYLDISELEAYHEGRLGADLGGLAPGRPNLPNTRSRMFRITLSNRCRISRRQYKYEGEVEVDLMHLP